MATELKIVDGMPSYANFVKATNSSMDIMEMFLAYLLAMGRGMNSTGIHYIDSTPLTVCLNMWRKNIKKNLDFIKNFNVELS